MKKFILACITICLLSGIGTMYLQHEGYRIYTAPNGEISLCIPPSDEELIKKDMATHILNVYVSEGPANDGPEKAISVPYTLLNPNVEVGNISNSMFTKNASNAIFTYSASEDTSKWVEQQNAQKRQPGNAGKLVDDGKGVVLEGYCEPTTLDVQKVTELFDRMFKNPDQYADSHISLESYRSEPNFSTKEQERINLWNKYQNFELSYSNGYVLRSQDLYNKGYISVQDDNIICTAENSNIRAILGANITSYNTVGTDMPFTTHAGDNITVASVTYGDYIDYKQEADYILYLTESWTSEQNRFPILKQEHQFDLASTYIEVDKDLQHAYYFVQGHPVLDWDIVTGLPTYERETPSGIYYIINKAKNISLKGPTWNVQVQRWMAVTYSGIGFHDADWRNSFGGNIYLSNGSHGCINTPTDDMFELYDMVIEGTPVVIY